MGPGVTLPARRGRARGRGCAGYAGGREGKRRLGGGAEQRCGRGPGAAVALDVDHVHDLVQAAVLRIGAEDQVGAQGQAVRPHGIAQDDGGGHPVAAVVLA